MSSNQQDILLSLVQSIEGKAWASERTGWKREESEVDSAVCSWEGVICDPTDQTTVTGLDLTQTMYAGTLPPELGQLVTLKDLKLEQNLFRGTIPVEIANLPHLEHFAVSENHLTGPLPAFASPSLLNFNVANNKLTGSLPDNVGERHARLESFAADGNGLEGTVPDSFGVMTKLNTLALSMNRLYGTIPVGLGKTKLGYLYLDNNEFVGIIPPELGKISQLEELWLQHNNLSGTIPAAIATIPNLIDLFVDGNKFTGTVPSALCRKELNDDFFEGVPEKDRNYCDSVACPVDTFSAIGVHPCEPCEEDSHSPYLGQVGHCIGVPQREILQILYGSMGQEGTLTDWDMNGNYCDFGGVTCDQNDNVIALELKGKDLTGTIPEEVGFLRYLERLDFSNNRLTGHLPSDLRWAPLEQLDVSGNQLVGIVPPMLCLKPGINGNGEGGDFNCDYIACSPGTFSSTGMGSLIGGKEKCMPCDDAEYLGSKVCFAETGRSTEGRKLKGGAVFGIFLMVSSLLVMIYITVRTLIRKREERIIRQDHSMKHINISEEVAFT